MGLKLGQNINFRHFLGFCNIFRRDSLLGRDTGRDILPGRDIGRDILPSRDILPGRDILS